MDSVPRLQSVGAEPSIHALIGGWPERRSASTRRKVPDPHHDILTPEEVIPFFTALAPGERPIFAAAIFTGLRKSELCGLLKTDVDLAGRRITVCRAYGRPWPKGRKKRIVRIATELVPFIEYALEALPGPWLLPDRKGRMHTPNWKPEKLLRTALRRAGIVTGFLHVCRRKGCGHEQEEKDKTQRLCPKCKMKLWPRAKSRPLRFHELRHTFGSVLIMSGRIWCPCRSSSATRIRRSPRRPTHTSRSTTCSPR